MSAEDPKGSSNRQVVTLGVPCSDKTASRAFDVIFFAGLLLLVLVGGSRGAPIRKAHAGFGLSSSSPPELLALAPEPHRHVSHRHHKHSPKDSPNEVRHHEGRFGWSSDERGSSREDEQVVFGLDDNESASRESDEDYPADQAASSSEESSKEQGPRGGRHRKNPAKSRKPSFKGSGSDQDDEARKAARPRGGTKRPKHKKKMVAPTRHPIRHLHHPFAGGQSSPRLGRYVQLYSKNGYNLKITINGTVEGTDEVRNELGECM